jgi:hypothetical protein
MHLPYPYNTFLFPAGDRFHDFNTVVQESIGLNPYGEYKSGQYPFLLIVGSLFSLIPDAYSYLVYCLTFAGTFFAFSLYFLRAKPWYLSLLPAFALTFMTYPFLVCLDRGNFESLVFLLLLAFIFFYSRKAYLPAAIFLAFAAALKIYPAIFLLLFLKEKKFKEIISCIGCTIGLTFISLLCFQGGLIANIRYLLNFSNINNNPVFLSFITLREGSFTQRGVTLLTLIKIFVQQNQINLPEYWLVNFPKYYILLACSLFIPIMFFVIYIVKERWSNVALLTFSMLLLPNISADYKLLHVLLPLFLFINTEKKSKLDYFYILMFGLLLIPKNYFYLSRIVSDSLTRTGNAHDITMAVPINILILIISSLVIMVSSLLRWNKKID